MDEIASGSYIEDEARNQQMTMAEINRKTTELRSTAIHELFYEKVKEKVLLNLND